MHARHRGPANGYRSNPMGIGGGNVAGGGPPNRNYNNRSGFGRGHQKNFQSGPPPRPSPPSRRAGDVFMEAGRLATEYLVSKGLLPANVLNGKWQNGDSKNYIGGGDYVPDAVSGTGGAMRRFPDDYSYPTGSRDGIRGRRRIGSFKNHGFEWNGEIDRSASSSAKVRGSSDKQVDDDAFYGSMEKLQYGEDGCGEEQQSVSGDLESKSCDAGNIETAMEKNQNQLPGDDVGLKAPSSDVSPEGGVESTERSDGSNNLNMGTEEVMMDDNTIGESEKLTVTEDTPAENCAEANSDTSSNKSGIDLLTLIRFHKVPTRTRSSITIKGAKTDPVLTADDENKNESHNSGESRGPLQHTSTDVSVGDVPSDERQELNPESNIPEAPSAEEVAKLDCEYKCEGQLEYNRCNSVVLDRGEKRPLCVIDSGEGAKKPRDGAPLNAQVDRGFHLSTSRGDQQSSQEGRSSLEEVITEQPCNDYAERKLPFPGSFKICDLNLMEGSNVNENHDANSAITFQPIGEPKQEAMSVDLSMSNSSSASDRHSSQRTDDKEVEVIDLESGSVQENKVFNNSERMDETIFTDLESFPDSMQRVNDMPQDGYGLMISELLEADIPSCSGAGVNPMHDEIGLRNDEGILDDESIYMSLGEIPISFVPVWDQQPSRGYDKPY